MVKFTWQLFLLRSLNCKGVFSLFLCRPNFLSVLSPGKTFYNVGDRIVRQPHICEKRGWRCALAPSPQFSHFLNLNLTLLPPSNWLRNLRRGIDFIASKEPQRTDETDRTIILSTSAAVSAAVALAVRPPLSLLSSPPHCTRLSLSVCLSVACRRCLCARGRLHFLKEKRMTYGSYVDTEAKGSPFYAVRRQLRYRRWRDSRDRRF